MLGRSGGSLGDNSAVLQATGALLRADTHIVDKAFTTRKSPQITPVFGVIFGVYHFVVISLDVISLP